MVWGGALAALTGISGSADFVLSDYIDTLGRTVNGFLSMHLKVNLKFFKNNSQFLIQKEPPPTRSYLVFKRLLWKHPQTVEHRRIGRPMKSGNEKFFQCSGENAGRYVGIVGNQPPSL
jgi:hypothetical protein